METRVGWRHDLGYIRESGQMNISPRIPRVALVTGAARRIGAAIALALAGAGFDIAVHFRTSRNEAESLAPSIRRLGRRAELFQGDLALESQIETLIEGVQAVLGPVGVLINNASLFQRDEWDTVTRRSWDAHLESNLRAPFVLTQHFARSLPAEAEGLVINMLDQRVWSLTPHYISYTVSKYALWGLTQSLALALAPRIRVNGIGPGPALPNAQQSIAQFEAQCASTPLRRGTSPQEIAEAVLAVLRLPAMTGQMIALDGAQHLQWKSGRLPPREEE
jgi:NAD(P)-dependent dehydrogenase (short-subunit alcohol dehydrogenase family)